HHFRDRDFHQVSAPDIETAAREFGLEKMDVIREQDMAHHVFNDIVSHVLHSGKSNGFLVGTELSTNDVLLYLVHNRVLHVWSRSYSAASYPGQRFLMVSIDFCIIWEHLRSPTYRHIAKELELPFTLDQEKEIARVRQEDASKGKLAALEAPDRRSVR